MKKISLLTAIIISTLGAYAQNDSTRNETNLLYNENARHQNRPDGYTFQDGNMLLVKNGIFTQIEEDTTLVNGIMVMCDGNYINKDGTKAMFKEGEHMDMSGNIILPINTDYYNKNNNYDQLSDGYVFLNGKMQVVKNGIATPVVRDITLSNGTIIMSDGNYLKNGGSKTMFKEGEHMDMSGKIIPLK
jgi:hypothetical protein